MSKKKEEMKELKSRSQIMMALFSFLGVAMIVTLLATNFTTKGTYSAYCTPGDVQTCTGSLADQQCQALQALGYVCSGSGVTKTCTCPQSSSTPTPTPQIVNCCVEGVYKSGITKTQCTVTLGGTVVTSQSECTSSTPTPTPTPQIVNCCVEGVYKSGITKTQCTVTLGGTVVTSQSECTSSTPIPTPTIKAPCCVTESTDTKTTVTSDYGCHQAQVGGATVVAGECPTSTSTTCKSSNGEYSSTSACTTAATKECGNGSTYSGCDSNSLTTNECYTYACKYYCNICDYGSGNDKEWQYRQITSANANCDGEVTTGSPKTGKCETCNETKESCLQKGKYFNTTTKCCAGNIDDGTTQTTCTDLIPSGSLFGGESKTTCEQTANAKCGLGNYTGCEHAIHDEDDTISCFTYKCKGSTTCADLISSSWIFGGESKTTCTANATATCGEGKYEGCEHAIHDEDDTISCFEFRCNGSSTCASLIPSGSLFGGESKSTCQTTANRTCGTGKYTGCEHAIHDEDDTISCFSYKCVTSPPTPTPSGGTTPPGGDGSGGDGSGGDGSGGGSSTDPSGETKTCYVCVSGESSQYVWASSSANAAMAATTLSGITSKNCATTSESNCQGIAVSNCYECNGTKKYVMATSDADAKSQSGGTSCTIVTTNKCNEVNPPKTGTFGIIVAWIIGMMTIGYAMWYFKKVKTY